MLLLTLAFAWMWQKSEVRYVLAEKNVYKKRVRRIIDAVLIVGTFLPMYFINASMSYVGNDYANYYRYYQNIAAGRKQDVDIAYKLINIFVINLGLDFQWVYFITCFIAYALLILCIWKYSENYALSYFLFFLGGYFFLLGLNQIRQFVTMGFVLFGMHYIQKKKFGKYVICICLAASFHFTAIVMIPFYFVLNKKIRLSFYFVVSMCVLPINFFLTEILTFLFKTFLPRYLQSNYVSKTYSLNVPYLTMILVSEFVILFLLGKNKRNRGNENNRIFFNATMIGTIMAMFCTWLPEYQRFVYYFFMCSIFFIPNLLKTEKKKWIRFLVLAVVVIADLIYLAMTVGEMNVLNYKSIF